MNTIDTHDLKNVLAGFIAKLLLLGGFLFMLWPMQIYILGTQVGGYPAPVYLISYLVNGSSQWSVDSPTGSDAGLADPAGGIVEGIARGILAEALTRTVIAVLLMFAGAAFMVYASSVRRRRRVEPNADYEPGYPEGMPVQLLPTQRDGGQPR